MSHLPFPHAWGKGLGVRGSPGRTDLSRQRLPVHGPPLQGAGAAGPGKTDREPDSSVKLGGRARRLGGKVDMVTRRALIVVLLVVVALVAAPLRRRGTIAEEDAERAELEAARDAKYREIRDAELDHRTGKLSAADWRAMDRSLRAEAVDILRRLDEL